MSRDNGNKPAFAHDGTYELPPQTGLTMREYFAAMAMQGILTVDFLDRVPHVVAKEAVRYADALLAALESDHE